MSNFTNSAAGDTPVNISIGGYSSSENKKKNNCINNTNNNSSYAYRTTKGTQVTKSSNDIITNFACMPANFSMGFLPFTSLILFIMYKVQVVYKKGQLG